MVIKAYVGDNTAFPAGLWVLNTPLCHRSHLALLKAFSLLLIVSCVAFFLQSTREKLESLGEYMILRFTLG